ncbi:MAG: DUF2723 domain-containing protein [Nitrospirae bacterium]|nr:DUF2723 domain-containing protein [Nitrospirota bacterium]
MKKDKNTVKKKPSAGRSTPITSPLKPARPAFIPNLWNRLTIIPNRPVTTISANWLHLFIVAACLLPLYAYTSPRTLALEDDGLFVMAARFLGIPQPPGYPLHSLLGWFFTHLPAGTVAYRLHLMSAVFGALTCCAVWLIIRTLVLDAACAYAGALLFGVSRVFWSQSIIAEVYTPNTFLFFSTVYLAMQYAAQPSRGRLRAFGIFYGLGLALHWPLVVLSSPGLVFLLLPRWKDILRDWHTLLISILPAAILPYVWMVVRSNMNPLISFYGPIRSMGEFIFFFLRRGFREVDTSQSAGLIDKLLFERFLLLEMLWQYTVIGAALALAGIWLQWKRFTMGTSLAWMMMWFSSSLLLGSVLAFDYEPLMQSVITVYPLIPYGVMAIWIAVALDAGFSRWVASQAAKILIVACLVVAVGIVNFGQNNRKDDTWPRDYAEALLSGLDKDAVLFTNGDQDAFPLGYFNLVEGMRPDVTLYNDQGLAFANRLYRFDDANRSAILDDFVRRSARPVYFIMPNAYRFATQDGGFYVKARPDLPDGRILFELGEPARAFVRKMEGMKLRDQWFNNHRDSQRRRFMSVLTYFKYFEPSVFESADLAELYGLLERTPAGRLGRLTPWAIDKVPPDEWDRYVDQAVTAMKETGSKKDLSLAVYMKGLGLLSHGREAEGVQRLTESVDIYPNRKNPAVMRLLEYYSEKRQQADFFSLGNRFFIGQTVDQPTTARLLQLGSVFNGR